MAGYSGTPLHRKLGIKPGHRVTLLDAPDGFEASLDGLPGDVVIRHGLSGDALADVIVLFVTECHELQACLDEVRRGMAQDGGFWVAWPKRVFYVATATT